MHYAVACGELLVPAVGDDEYVALSVAIRRMLRNLEPDETLELGNAALLVDTNLELFMIEESSIRDIVDSLGGNNLVKYIDVMDPNYDEYE